MPTIRLPLYMLAPLAEVASDGIGGGTINWFAPQFRGGQRLLLFASRGLAERFLAGNTQAQSQGPPISPVQVSDPTEILRLLDQAADRGIERALVRLSDDDWWMPTLAELWRAISDRPFDPRAEGAR